MPKENESESYSLEEITRTTNPNLDEALEKVRALVMRTKEQKDNYEILAAQLLSGLSEAEQFLKGLREKANELTKHIEREQPKEKVKAAAV